MRALPWGTQPPGDPPQEVTLARSLEERARLRTRLPTPDECRRLRVAALIEAQEMAQELGINKATLWKWESGVSSPTGPTRDRYAELLENLAKAVA